MKISKFAVLSLSFIILTGQVGFGSEKPKSEDADQNIKLGIIGAAKLKEKRDLIAAILDSSITSKKKHWDITRKLLDGKNWLVGNHHKACRDAGKKIFDSADQKHKSEDYKNLTIAQANALIEELRTSYRTANSTNKNCTKGTASDVRGRDNVLHSRYTQTFFTKVLAPIEKADLDPQNLIAATNDLNEKLTNTSRDLNDLINR